MRGVCPPLPYQTLENKFSVFSSHGGGVTPLRVGRTTGANPGGYQAGARGILARGITYVAATGVPPREKGVWDLADAISLVNKLELPFLCSSSITTPAQVIGGPVAHARLTRGGGHRPAWLARHSSGVGGRSVTRTLSARCA